MDKWDDSLAKTKNAILANEPEAALAAMLGFFAELGRTIELLGEDVGRIADALEKRNAEGEAK